MLKLIALCCLATALAAVETGTPAPGFSLTSATGATVSLAEHAGKHVVLEWINVDCPFVKKHYGSGNIPALQKRYTEQGVVWLSICSSAPGKQGNLNGEALTTRLAADGWAGSAYLIDANGTVGKAYDAKTTPHIYIINPAGTLIYQGGIDSIRSADPADIPKAVDYVSTTLDAALAGKPVPTASSKPYGCSVKYP
ncbi:MAG: thioredoxin family protein [Planctomycetota bacterium]|jgi:glutathione peroxidase-family protein|nr:thioredoxin family protein [Planctomycetota bacterium]